MEGPKNSGVSLLLVALLEARKNYAHAVDSISTTLEQLQLCTRPVVVDIKKNLIIYILVMRHSIVRGIFRSKSLQEGYRSLWQTLQSSNRASPCPRLPFQSLHDKDYVRFMSTTPPNNEAGSTTPSPTKTSPAVGQPSLEEDSSSESSTLLPFPWRINAMKPLPRVIENNDYSGMELTPWARFVRKSFVALELNASWVDIVFWKRWEQEIIQSAAFAFQRAMSGLLSRSFQGEFIHHTRHFFFKDPCYFHPIGYYSTHQGHYRF